MRPQPSTLDTKGESMPEKSIQLKITLKGMRPPIWRRFVVPASIRLDKLHDVVQMVMGWDSSHLYAFDIFGEQYSDGDLDDAELAHKYSLKKFNPYKGMKFSYIYDFGDDWEHEIVVEDTDYQPDVKKLARLGITPSKIMCIAGKRACPIEDIGGIWGYEGFLEALKDPSSRKYDYYMKIFDFDPDYDSESFDLHSVNECINML
jgi:hypothetical protein